MTVLTNLAVKKTHKKQKKKKEKLKTISFIIFSDF